MFDYLAFCNRSNRFISESVYDLRSRLRSVGSDLMIRFGIPEDVINNLVNALRVNGDHVEGVWMQKEMTFPETEVEAQIAKKLHGTGVPFHLVHGKTLIHPADLPFDSSETPDVFTPFRKKVEALGSKMVRPCKMAPTKFKPFPRDLPVIPDYALDVSYEVDVDNFSQRPPESKEKQEGQVSYHDILRFLLTPLNDVPLPSTLESGSLLQQRHPASAFPLRGGETAALDRLDWYFVRGKSADSTRWGKLDPPPVARYKQTRNNLLGHAYSTKMSPFLSYGSISPRQIWEALNAHEEKFGEDQNTYWVRFELLWRDYFFFVAEKFGDLLYDQGGFERATDPRQAAKKLEDGWWRKWDPVNDGPEHEMTRLLEGRTGIPFIDANILELRESGFMSNRGRQNVASFLSKDLGYDWRIGAEFFRSHLIDYDPTSNYGNWQYVAGVGNDPRASRQFNTIKQAKDYDSHGEYVKMWIPALRNLHPDHVHTPWLLDAEERRRYGLKATKMDVTMDGYPEKPLFEHEGWRRHYERRQGVGSKMYGNPQEKVKDGKIPRRHRPGTRIRGASGVSNNSLPVAFPAAKSFETAPVGTSLPNALSKDRIRTRIVNPSALRQGNSPGLNSMGQFGADRLLQPNPGLPNAQTIARMPIGPGGALSFGANRSGSFGSSTDGSRTRRSGPGPGPNGLDGKAAFLAFAASQQQQAETHGMSNSNNNNINSNGNGNGNGYGDRNGNGNGDFNSLNGGGLGSGASASKADTESSWRRGS